MAQHAPNGNAKMSDEGKLERGESHDEELRTALEKIQSLSPEVFERVYLSPKNQVKGGLRNTFANPTPLALLGFSVGLLPLSCEFMYWRGSGGFAVATTTCSIWYGGMCLVLAGIGEFLLGNTFPFLVFVGYGCHFLTFATTFIPWFNAISYYGGSPAEPEPMFVNSFGFYPISLCLLSFVYLVGSLRTNAVFVTIFVAATTGFGLASGAYWAIGAGSMEYGIKLVMGVGGCFFVASVAGWYLLLVEMITIMELPVPDLPVFDLSNVIKAKPRVK